MDLIVVAALLLRWFLACVFLSAGWNKTRHTQVFERELGEYGLLPRSLVRPFAMILPAAEMGLGWMLLMGWGVKLAAVSAAWLLTIFIMAMGINLVRGRRPNCGCSGPGRHRQIDLNLIVYDFLLLTVSLSLAALGGGPLSLDALAYPLKELLFFGYVLPLVLTISSALVTVKLVKLLKRLLVLRPV